MFGLEAGDLFGPYLDQFRANAANRVEHFKTGLESLTSMAIALGRPKRFQRQKKQPFLRVDRSNITDRYTSKRKQNILLRNRGQGVPPW
jgi:hypothetical protein